MPESPNSAETSSGSEKLGIIDDIKQTIGEITSGIRKNLGSVLGGFGILMKKGFDRLFGNKEQSSANNDNTSINADNQSTSQSDTNDSDTNSTNSADTKISSPSDAESSSESDESTNENEDSETVELQKKVTVLQEALEKMLPRMVSIKKGDITEEKDVDAIVNAANTGLTLGGGVAGAIKEKGGDKVVQACKEATKNGQKKIDIGKVVVTEGGNLDPKIIHAPVMDLGGESSPENIRHAVVAIVKEAISKNLKVIAIPALGAGSGKVKPEDSAKAIFEGLKEALPETTKLKKIILVLHNDEIETKFKEEFGFKKRSTETDEAA